MCGFAYNTRCRMCNRMCFASNRVCNFFYVSKNYLVLSHTMALQIRCRTHAFTIFAMSSIIVDFFCDFLFFLPHVIPTLKSTIHREKIARNKLNPPNIQLGWQQQHMYTKATEVNCLRTHILFLLNFFVFAEIELTLSIWCILIDLNLYPIIRGHKNKCSFPFQTNSFWKFQKLQAKFMVHD